MHAGAGFGGVAPVVRATGDFAAAIADRVATGAGIAVVVVQSMMRRARHLAAIGRCPPRYRWWWAVTMRPYPSAPMGRQAHSG